MKGILSFRAQRGICFSFLASVLLCLPASGYATTVSGTIKKPDGTPLNGTIEFTLSQPAKTTTPPVTFAPVKTTCAVTAGAIAAGCTVQGNDTLDPAGTFYRIRVLDLNNLVVVPSANYTISGTAVDLSSLPVTATDTLVPPTGSVTGNLNVTGNLTVGGSATFGADPENFSHLRLLGLTADPATVASGSIFHRSDLNRIRFRAGGLEIFDGSQYLPVSASSLGTIEFGANLSLPGLYSAAFKRMNDLRLVDPFLWLESGVPAKINAAIADCGGLPCRIVLPSNLSAGWPADSTWAESASLLDLRGNTTDPRNIGNFLSPFKFIHRKTTDSPGLEAFSTLRLLMLHDLGGENQTGGPKDQYHAIAADLIAGGRGEDATIRAQILKNGSGDAVAIGGSSLHHGNCLEGGGECAVGLRGASRQGDAVMTATISSAIDNGTTWTLNYTGAVNDSRRGVDRQVINTNPAKIYTTGTVTGFAGTPPTVTGSGTAWATQFGAGSHTDLCFSQNDDDAAGFKFVLPVRSITDDTHLVLDFNPQAADKSWPGSNDGSSSYRLYFCGKTTSYTVEGGSLTVAEGATNWAASDTMEVPLGWAWFGSGLTSVVVNPLPSFSANGLTVTNTPSDEPLRNAVSIGGKAYFGLNFDNAWECWGNNSNCSQGNTMGIRFAFMPAVGIQFPALTGTDKNLLQTVDGSGTTGSVNFKYSDGSDCYYIEHSAALSNLIQSCPLNGAFTATISAARTYFQLGVAGTAPAAGLFRISSGNGGTPILITRNQANSASVNLVTYSTSDRLQLSQSGTAVEFLGGVHSDGGGFKHRRVSTGSIAASSSAAVTVLWTTTFADANYTATCSVVEATAGTSSLRIHHLESVSASSVVVRVVNDDGATAKTGTLQCVAIHD